MGAIWVQGDPIAERIRLVAEVDGGEELEEGQDYDGDKGEGLHRRPRPRSRIDVRTERRGGRGGGLRGGRRPPEETGDIGAGPRPRCCSSSSVTSQRPSKSTVDGSLRCSRRKV